MLKSLLMASAMTLAVSGSAMAGNAASASSTGCTTCAAPAQIKLAQFNPRDVRGILNQAQQFDVPREGVVSENTITTCCPPIALQKAKFGSMFRLQQSAGKNVTQTYGVTFAPTTELDNQMKAFAPFLGLQTGTLHPNSVHLRAEMRQLKEGPLVDVNSTHFNNDPGNTPGDHDVPVVAHSLRAWWIPPVGQLTPSGVWNGDSPNFWENQFEDFKPSVSPNHMAPDKWYMIKLTWQVAMKIRPDDKSWIVKDLNCTNARPIFVRFLVRGGATFKTSGAQFEQISIVN